MNTLNQLRESVLKLEEAMVLADCLDPYLMNAFFGMTPSQITVFYPFDLGETNRRINSVKNLPYKKECGYYFYKIICLWFRLRKWKEADLNEVSLRAIPKIKSLMTERNQKVFFDYAQKQGYSAHQAAELLQVNQQ